MSKEIKSYKLNIRLCMSDNQSLCTETMSYVPFLDVMRVPKNPGI